MNIDKLLYDLHAIIIKLINTDENGRGNCCTCNDRLTFKTADCGHYPNIPRNNKRYAWDLIIHSIQCQTCNRYNNGEPEKFRDYLINKIGIEKLAEIEFKSRKDLKWFKSDKQQLVKEFRKQIRELLKDKNFTINIP